ncbi:transcription factor [Ganoderma sinense ZZ0214-1]|uniref:Transcription factor n=1 Tax=Ganoderma sinense ZZ0214-1 TaxID=1077348 RepID=A0A2G8RXK7_9APHY|nr:transcription factor [Ganoderma sinense ZZ0214-1]
MDFSYSLASASRPGGAGGDGGGHVPVPIRMRARAPQACMNCRKQKHRCEGGRPCNRCTWANVMCHWSDRPRGRKRKTSPSTASTVVGPKPKKSKRKAKASNTAQSQTTADQGTVDAPAPSTSHDFQDVLDYTNANPAAVADMFPPDSTFGSGPFDDLPSSLPAEMAPPSLLGDTSLPFPPTHPSFNPALIDQLPNDLCYPQDLPLGVASTLPFSGTTLIAGVPFYPSTPAGRDATIQSPYDRVDLGGFDPTLFSDPLSLLGPSVAVGRSDDIHLYGIPRDVSQDQWLDAVLQIGTSSVPEMSDPVPVLFPYQDPHAPVNSSPFPDDVPTQDDAYSDPSLYNVIGHDEPFLLQEPVHNPFGENVLSFSDLSFAVGPWVGGLYAL